MPEPTVRLIAEAPTLEPLVALRQASSRTRSRPILRRTLVERILAHRLRDRPAALRVALAGRRRHELRRVGPPPRAPRSRRSSLHGTEDVVVDPANAELLAERVPDARLELVPRVRAPPLLGGARALRCSRGRVPRMSGRLTIGRWLYDRARNTPERVAIEFADARWITYADLAGAPAGWPWRSPTRGVVRGDRVATLTANSPDHVALLFACARPRRSRSSR